MRLPPSHFGKTPNPVSFGPAGEAGDEAAHPKGLWAGRYGSGNAPERRRRRRAGRTAAQRTPSLRSGTAGLATPSLTCPGALPGVGDAVTVVRGSGSCHEDTRTQ